MLSRKHETDWTLEFEVIPRRQNCKARANRQQYRAIYN